MDAKFQTSFIPKKSVLEEKSSGSSVSLFMLISIIIFLVSLGLFGWVFLEKKNLVRKIEEAKNTIEANRSQFEINTIESVIRLDSRIKAANILLASHVSISPVFNFLQDQTLKTVRFKNFHFSGSRNDSGEPIVKVEMSGQTRDYRTIALQAEEFGKPKWREIIKNPVFADLTRSSDGSVSFTSSMLIVPSFINYSQNLSN